MRAFFWFFGLVLAALFVGALIAFPAYQLAATFSHFAFHRVAGRIAMLILALELVWLCRHLNIRTRGDFGFGLPRPQFIQQVLVWLAIGITTASAGAAFLLISRLRVIDASFVFSGINCTRLLLVGIGSGLSVALIEETVMRGAMHTAIERESGPWAAALLTAPLFALMHLFAKVKIPSQDVHWGSGFDLLIRSFAPLHHPLLVLDSLLSWLIVGLILSLTRALTGNIAVAMGLHAGWVVILRVLADSTVANASPSYSFWIGSFDGLLGYWLLPWGALIGFALWITRAHWTDYASTQ